MSSPGEFRVITFNDILRAGGIEPDVTRVKLLRHIEMRNRIDVHDMWRNQRELFEAWQARQWDDFFTGVDYVASFVVSRAGETVFVGLYAVGGGWTEVGAGTPDPMTGTPADPRTVQHQLTQIPDFDTYADRLVVQWFRAGKARVQQAPTQSRYCSSVMVVAGGIFASRVFKLWWTRSTLPQVVGW